jgi:crossover junction endodeoxyribonuclease RuvC
MLAIGIDPGTATTGYGLVREAEDGSLHVVDYGVVLTAPELEMPERLLRLFQELKQVLVLHRPACGAVEKLFFQKNVRTALSVGQARGVVLLALAEAGIEVWEYTPMEVKQAVTGYGGAEKVQVQEMVRMLLNLKEIPQPDDAADALAIAICRLNSARFMALSEGR